MRCVPAHDFNVAKAMAWHSAIADDPPYQRESSLWSLEKQQLFVDSLLNGYDVPKIYLHDLRGKHPTRVYAVVDGKQRLSTIWRFLRDEFPLARDFRIEPGNLPDLPAGVRHPSAGDRFSDLDPAWQQVLRMTHLAVVLIQNAVEEDIEDLFARLNNGEPLNAAERRNAVGGDATRLVREVAGHPLFASRVAFANSRYQHRDAAARLLLLEFAALNGGEIPDVRSRALDAFVRGNRRLPSAVRRDLRNRVARNLDRMTEIFEDHDPLLASQLVLPVYYLLVRSIETEAPAGWAPTVRGFLDDFEAERRAQLGRTEEEQDEAVREFNALVHAGANEAHSLSRRLEILLEALRATHPATPAAPALHSKP